MHKDIVKVMFTKEEIERACKRLGEQITQKYKGEKLRFIGILKGSFVFMADLIRHVDTHCEVDFMGASSYYGTSTESSGVVTITKELDLPVEGYHVVIVEDIVDTGNTLMSIKEYLEAQGALSIEICALFDKPCRRIKNINVDFSGFKIGNEFIVGYGLDFNELYRNLPYVGVLNPNLYKNEQ